MAVTSFAHLSDPHLALAAGLPMTWRSLAGKRGLAYLSWRLSKRRHHVPAALQAVCADIARHDLDHILVTGDLTNMALPDEFAAAADWLRRLAPAGRISVVPGNHDATASLPWRDGLSHWLPWMMNGEATSEPPVDASTAFPFIRRQGPVAFINLSTAIPTPPGVASGRLGDAQIAHADKALSELGRAGLFRVVAMHHPPVAGIVSARKGLSDQPAFQAMLADAGAELVVHGHCHRSHFGTLPGPSGPVPVLGVPSASAPRDRKGRYARWHLFEVTRSDGEWSLTLTVRGLQDDGACASEGGWTMRLPVACSATEHAPGPLAAD
jgi:3',5'-cyclic AMP phosphodiesterase CpdA